MKSRSVAQRLARAILPPVAHVVDSLVPKRKDLWAFPYARRDQWGSNQRAVYEHLRTRRDLAATIERIDLSPEVSALELVTGLWHLLRAGVVVNHHGRGDFLNAIEGGGRIVYNVWHGANIKGIGHTASPDAEARRRLENEAMTYTGLLASGKLNRLSLAAAFFMPLEQIDPLGLPRNDWLLVDADELPTDLREAEQRLQGQLEGRRLVTYAPTFRAGGSGFYAFGPDEIAQLEDLLSEHNAVLGTRAHINASPAELPGNALDLGSGTYPEVQVVLRNTNLLLTDYSGIWIDYLLLDRPMVGFCHDWDTYLEELELVYDLETVFPGPIAKDYPAFLAAITASLGGNEAGEAALNRGWTKRLFHAYVDAGASKRVVDRIITLQGTARHRRSSSG